jgi:hypothetical protein
MTKASMASLKPQLSLPTTSRKITPSLSSAKLRVRAQNGKKKVVTSIGQRKGSAATLHVLRDTPVEEIDHHVTWLGTFKDKDLQAVYMSVFYNESHLNRRKQWCLVVAVISALWSMAGFDKIANDDVGHGLLAIFPCAIVLAVALLIDSKDVPKWLRYQTACLFAACLFSFGNAYDHYMQFRANGLLKQGFKSCREPGPGHCQPEDEWAYIDMLWTLFVASSSISLLIIFIVAKQTFQLPLRQLVVLAPVVILTQIVLTSGSYWHRRELGFQERTGWLTTFMVANVGMVFAIVEMLFGQRAFEVLTRTQFLKRLDLTDQLDVAMEQLQLANGEDQDDEMTADKLDEFILNGSVRSILHRMFSKEDSEIKEAMAACDAFTHSADTVIPLTFEENRAQKEKSQKAGKLLDHDQLDRIASARCGLEVAQAWMNRISGADWEEGSVFLGGSCNPTTWRRDAAIPMLEEAGVSYYNPQVEEWSEELVEIEAKAKESASVLLFVIGKETRALASVAEAAEYICRGRNIVMVIEDVPASMCFDGVGPSKAELKDLNRGRSYLRDIATRHAVACQSSVEDAVLYIIQQYQRAQVNTALKRAAARQKLAQIQENAEPTVSDDAVLRRELRARKASTQGVGAGARGAAPVFVEGTSAREDPSSLDPDYNSQSMRMVTTLKPLPSPKLSPAAETAQAAPVFLGETTSDPDYNTESMRMITTAPTKKLPGRSRPNRSQTMPERAAEEMARAIVDQAAQ